MIKATNIAPGPRGMHTKDGPVMLMPSQTLDVDMTAEEIAVARNTGWFTFEGDSAKDVTASLDTMQDEELRALLAQKGVQADGLWGHDKLVTEAKKALSA